MLAVGPPNDRLALVGFFPRNVGFRSPFKSRLKKGMRQRLISRGVLVRLNEERMGTTKVCLMPFLSIMYFASQREFRQFVFTARLVDFISQFTSEGLTDDG